MSRPDRRFVWLSAETAQSKFFSQDTSKQPVLGILQLLNSVFCLLPSKFA